MKNFYLIVMLFACGLYYGQNGGIWGSYVIKSGSDFFICQNPGNGDTTNPNFQSTSLGTFNRTQSLTLGGQEKTWHNNGSTLNNTVMNYRVYLQGSPAGSFTQITLSHSSDDGGNNNQTWQTSSNSINIIPTGAVDGTYTVEVYFQADVDGATVYDSNSSNNYKGSFVIDNSSLGVSDIENAKHNFVTNGALYTTQKGNLDLQIYDYSGRILKSFNVSANGNPIDLGIHVKGQYILVITDGNVKETVKFAR